MKPPFFHSKPFNRQRGRIIISPMNSNILTVSKKKMKPHEIPMIFHDFDDPRFLMIKSTVSIILTVESTLSIIFPCSNPHFPPFSLFKSTFSTICPGEIHPFSPFRHAPWIRPGGSELPRAMCRALLMLPGKMRRQVADIHLRAPGWSGKPPALGVGIGYSSLQYHVFFLSFFFFWGGFVEFFSQCFSHD